ncbi:glycerol-3-phosphate 1-O-acyltransferase PlsY [Neisseria meningitidis]|uniref:Glycerol-3-phosphate acyltransferase n=1 Tax=Neisseria meningitidis serogroup C (strain 053442) TaxID=374833 RepID=PLSY_NEIM0|nr:glycerol-3-phosphate 1-O-acyltransferase PlsY [Neisseria meningitidis]A9LYY1.1 RecName: Full=Glycerol-3-phosphate acyltransferase; AltName: Full=Acyl-PO4 G3P acyltransferase; AltName: Full=Acyl-phosphate--glycerol-3-phosphate acyltransferase; AltName: Full=G3P acyltransferase; Short=GPAT; AltName: Full=Lysophosphatidic acid synthase; Short=LPA synthase [Neisseria meningitidis 053442]ABX73158.1 integral membrane protein [Neisseria meningitidis 053442]EOC32761.1 acyl-phosphate glycerol 3-phosph
MFNISAVAVSYLIGSLSFAVIVSKYYGMDDPRTYGSGNPGATNVLRSGKKKAAALTLLGDAAKGLVAVLLARVLQEPLGLSDSAIAAVALAALVGHMWPVFFGFKGGKGVATALGVLLALSPATALVCALIWLVMAFGFKVSSLAALTATIAAPLAALFFMPHTSWIWATLLIALLVLFRHKSNIVKLLEGRESKIGGSR